MLLRPATRPVVRPICRGLLDVNNNGWPLRSQLLDGATIRLPLTHTAVPTRGSITPTFTRATTATFTDFEGVLRTVPAGCARFTGARMVQNLVNTTSEDFSNAAWAKLTAGAGSVPVITSGFTDPNGGSTAYRLQADAGGSSGADFSILRNTLSAASRHLSSLWIKSNTGASQTVGVGVLDVGQSVIATTTWQRLTVAPYASASNIFDISVYPAANGSQQTIDVLIWRAQLEDITGRTDQTTPSEYVSVGVASAPYYHGSMADGVKCFDTDLSGNPIAASTLKGYLAEPAATNRCLQSNALTTTWTSAGTLGLIQNVVGPDGAVSAWTLTDNDAAANEVLYQPITLTAANYTNHCLVGKTTGAQASYPCLYAYDGASARAALCTIDTSNGVATVWTAYTGLTVQASSARCSSYNDDFWLVELTFLGTAATWTNAIAFAPAITTNPTQSTGIFDVTVQGSSVACNFQCELGSAATSYIATTTAAVARNADVLTYTGGDIPNLKTLAATFRREVGVSNVGVVCGVSDTTLNNCEVVDLQSATAVKFEGTKAGAAEWATTASNAYTPATFSKAAWSAAANDIKMDFNGTAQTQDTTAAIPGTTVLDVGHLAGSYQLNGHVGHIYGWTRNMSQSELGAVDR